MHSSVAVDAIFPRPLGPALKTRREKITPQVTTTYDHTIQPTSAIGIFICIKCQKLFMCAECQPGKIQRLPAGMGLLPRHADHQGKLKSGTTIETRAQEAE